MADLRHELVETRRDIHAHPETSWQESRTTELVAARLEKEGIAVQALPRSGLMAEVGDASPSAPVVALRADLDRIADALAFEVPSTTAFSRISAVFLAAGYKI